jgi:high-affinity iron transporter
VAVATRRTARFWATWGIWILASLTIVAVIAGIAVVAQSGSPDPTEATTAQSHAVVVVNSSIIVFREGLEAILIFAAVTASMLGAQRRLRKPVVVGAAVAFAATLVTWFVAQAVLAQFSAYSGALLAITGLVAIGVLLVIMNWFFHKVYWTQWIGKRNDQRKRALARSAEGGFLAGQAMALVLLGFSSVYREGFEVVLFLQTLQLQAGTPSVLEGVAIGLAGTAAVGVVTFSLEQKLPYRRMLVVTGILLGVVLVVMVGGSARTLEDLGWVPTTPVGVGFPDWLARWLEIVPTVESLGAQLTAALLVVGSYFAARYVQVQRRQNRGESPAIRPTSPPPEPGRRPQQAS